MRRGLAAIWLGIGHVLFWIAWVALEPWGVAIPEIVGSIAFYAWILLTVRTLPVDSRGSS